MNLKQTKQTLSYITYIYCRFPNCNPNSDLEKAKSNKRLAPYGGLPMNGNLREMTDWGNHHVGKNYPESSRFLIEKTHNFILRTSYNLCQIPDKLIFEVFLRLFSHCWQEWPELTGWSLLNFLKFHIFSWHELMFG